jgi:hypothetical protein
MSQIPCELILAFLGMAFTAAFFLFRPEWMEAQS